MSHNGGVYVSGEILAITIATASLLITLGGMFFAGFSWIIRRIDRVQSEVADVRVEVTEVKIAVARLEGPPRQLLLPR